MSPPKNTGNDATIVATKVAPQYYRKTFACLVIVQGSEIGKQYALRRNSHVIGRTAGADIMVKDNRVSRTHAEINVIYNAAKKLTTYMLIDLGSTNHVYVNGKQVQEHVLKSGDKIHVGDTILNFAIQDAVDAKFHADLQRKIEYDDLTSLLTYDSFKTALCWELENTQWTKNGFSLLMMDLDDFKRANDTYGHLTGSFILKEVGMIIRDNLRQLDVSARYGGEEFITYLPDTAKREGFYAAERLRKKIASRIFSYIDKKVRISISVGISHFPENGATLEELVRLADEMLYKAKKDGKNRVYVTE